MKSYPLVHAAAGQPDGIILPPLGKGLFTGFVPVLTLTHSTSGGDRHHLPSTEPGLRLVKREWPTDVGPVDLM